MRRPVLALAATVALGVWTSTAAAEAQVPNPNASCVAVHSTADAHSAPGALGAEISGFATLAPGIIGQFASETAQIHMDSLGGCPSE